MQLIHYGNNKFNEEKFLPIKNVKWDKPIGGLWTSPINSVYSWKQWCKNSCYPLDYFKQFFQLELKTNTKLFKIDFYKDLLKIPILNDNFFRINFEQMAQEYDAIHLTVRGLHRTTQTKYIGKPNLYGWDAETVLILNKNCIKLI